jgi:hypothetical protein
MPGYLDKPKKEHIDLDRDTELPKGKMKRLGFYWASAVRSIGAVGRR